MADDNKEAEFAFNLFTDIAPLLALFGEQFARQFTSESLTWVDHLILAMAPLGIITVITGAIRVQGPRIAKSFIGRGRENRALAEIELMSSTSKEVCELFNGKSIIRVMGKPMIAQILIFPKEYERLKKKYEETDQKRLYPDLADNPVGNNKPVTNSKAIENDMFTKDSSCGIHTFKTAAFQEGERAALLEYEEYHSRSYQIISNLFKRLKGPKNRTRKNQLNCKNTFKWLGPPNLQLGLSSDQFEKGFPKKGHEVFIAAVVAVVLQASLIAIASVTIYHERTRRAISFEPKDYGYPCYIAGSILLSMGVGICSLAVERNTVEYDWKILARNKSGGESAYERIPAVGNETDIDDSPRLLWLQQSQEVNDQSFSGYAILAGPKHHVITSSRIEDTGPMLDFSNSERPKGRIHDEHAKVVTDRDYVSDPTENSHISSRTWELITVGAAVVAGLGFVIQFMGLRGLTYPCSIAQLVAILLMALIRAIIRRRLGREPYHCPAFPRFEVDFLATRIVYSRTFREFHVGLKNQIPLLNQQKSEQILCWKIKIAKANDDHPFLSKTLQDFRDSHASRGGRQILIDLSESLFNEPNPLKRSRNLLTTEDTSEKPPIEVASSQQLLRVRERLGDLCNWRSEALESARTLIDSVEAFMDHFFPKRLNSLGWAIETIGLSNEPSIGRPDYVTISVQRSSDNDRWQVAIGTIEAILSLWTASIEAQAADARKSSDEGNADKTPGQNFNLPNWRRTKAGIDLRYNYCRILGDDFEDGALKRDLSWWVDELIADQSDSRPVSKHGASTNKQDVESKIEGFSVQKGSDSTDNQWKRSNARVNAKATDLIIGFNGRSEASDPRRLSSQNGARELGISSSGLLPNILAQHLFTSFIWTVVEHLPEDCLRQGNLGSEQDVEIEGRHTFDPHEFVDTWRRPTLRHRQLTKLVRQLEGFGLGSQTEVLLCIIPAFSFKDLLPNHVILKLIPQIRRGQGWAETARCYNRLLEQSMRVAPQETMAEEKFCYNVVVATVDFLSFASEPYDGYVLAPDELSTELEDIVARLVSTRFSPVIKKLAQAYILQRRHENIESIFRLFGTPGGFKRLVDNQQVGRSFGSGQDLDGCVEALRASTKKLDFTFLEKSLGFSKSHRVIYVALSDTSPEEDKVQMSLYLFQVNAAKTRDLFDWTPLHYASFLRDKKLLSQCFDPEKVKSHLSLHRVVGPFGRSPIHIAAISGSEAATEWILNCLGSGEDTKNAFNMVGSDGMSPLHLATKSGNLNLVKKIIENKHIRTTTGIDFWGRTAIHLAASYGYDEITTILLKNDSQIDTVDEIGKTPLGYLVKRADELRDVGNDEDIVEDKDVLNAPKKELSDKGPDENMAERKRKIFLEFASKNPSSRDKRGRTFLHHAVEHTNINTIEELLSKGYDIETKDSAGLTPLHLALYADRPKIALKLLKGLSGLEGLAASPSAKDERGYTPLMFAAERGYIDVVRFLVEFQSSKPREAERIHSQEEREESGYNGSNQALISPDEAFGPLVRGYDGRTALHIALHNDHGEVAAYLLHDTDQIQENPHDRDMNTLLVAAASTQSSSTCFSSILKRWPEIINQPDSEFGQTPLSWACEMGFESIVDMLLTCENLDLNKPAPGWMNYTPLHAAVTRNHVTIVQKLLSNENIVIDAKDFDEETAIDMATDAQIMQALLTHRLTNSKGRLEFLLRCCKFGEEDMQEIIPEILEHIGNEDITDKDLIELIDISEDIPTSAPYKAFVKRAFDRDTWKSMNYPYHKVLRIGSLELVRLLTEHAKDPADVDEDSWSCIDYANTYCSTNLEDSILHLVLQQPSWKLVQPPIEKPRLLHYSKLSGSVEVSSCNEFGHKECLGINFVKVAKQDDKLTHACIRSQKCIPPFAEGNKSFYYEVNILNASSSKILGLGFCNKRYCGDAMPGWYPISWAYHSDDGALFVNFNGNPNFSVWGETPSDDFGAKGEFGVNDTAGVGLNLETGEGFVTLNGKRKDVGTIFEGKRFNSRKMYPCLGIDCTEEGVGLSFVVNFGGSVDHPFVYKGPYL